MTARTDLSASIIIVNYNGKHFLHACITSVIRDCGSRAEIIVVDNASVDGSVQFLRSTFPDVSVIESGMNLGFAGGNNLGVRHAACDLIILLNNDTVVHAGWFQGLLDAVRDDDVACASSLIKTEGIPEWYYEMNGSVNFLGHNIMRVFSEPTDIFFAGGASMIFKRNLLGEPFDEEYFVYAEDVYLGFRTRFLGLKVKHTNDSRLDHFGNGTSKHQQSSFLTFYQERNRILNVFSFFSVRTIFKVTPFLLMNCIGKIVASCIGMKYSFKGLMRAYGWFFLHLNSVLRKRSRLQSVRTVDEREVIRWMSGKLTNGESIPGKIVNSIAVAYCRLVRLDVKESLK